MQGDVLQQTEARILELFARYMHMPEGHELDEAKLRALLLATSAT